MKKPVRRSDPQGRSIKSDQKHFYESIVTHESIVLEIDTLEMSSTERWHLVSLVESMLHNAVLDTVLSHLQPEDKKIFLSHVAAHNHDSVWKLLHEKVEGAEQHIKKTAENIFVALRQDIHEARQKKE